MIRAAALAIALALAGGGAIAETEPRRDSLPLQIVGNALMLELGPGDMRDVTGRAYGALIDLHIALDPAATEMLLAFTTAHIGQEVQVIGCGTELLRIRVIEPISGGQLALGGLEETVARQLWRAVTGEAACPAE